MPADIKRKMLERTIIGLMALHTLKVDPTNPGPNSLLLALEPDDTKRAKIQARLEARTALMLSRAPSDTAPRAVRKPRIVQPAPQQVAV